MSVITYPEPRTLDRGAYRILVKEDYVRKFACLFMALLMGALAGCGSGVTVQGDSPVDIPQEVTVGGVTVQAPEEIEAGGMTVGTEDGKVTVR
jgi:hypothetical protein